ncbi:hypothetical protein EV2_031988 [Malus domestica]
MLQATGARDKTSHEGWRVRLRGVGSRPSMFVGLWVWCGEPSCMGWLQKNLQVEANSKPSKHGSLLSWAETREQGCKLVPGNKPSMLLHVGLGSDGPGLSGPCDM